MSSKKKIFLCFFLSFLIIISGGKNSKKEIASKTSDFLFLEPKPFFQKNSSSFVLQNLFLKSEIAPVQIFSKSLATLQESRREILEFEVEKGDTISSIAQKFSLKKETIIWANNLSENSKLKVGQKLIILPVDGVLHQVKKGETLSEIAKRYKANIKDIVYFNDSSFDIDGYIVNWTWSFGDGNISYERNTTHRYEMAGTYLVNLTVTDNNGAENSIIKPVIVNLSDNLCPLIFIKTPSSRHIYLFGKEYKFPLKMPWIIGKVIIEVTAEDNQSGLEKVEFYVNNKLKYTDHNPPYSWTWSERSFGKVYNIKVKAYDRTGNTATDDVAVRLFSFSK